MSTSAPGAERPWVPVDPLAGVLADLRMRGTFYCRTEATAPWGMEMPAFDGCLSVHVVTDGSCRLEVDGADCELQVGDLALVPHGRGHLLRSDPGARILGRADLLPQDHLGEHYSVLRLDGGGARTAMVCGVLEIDRPGAAHVLDLLPPVVVVGGRDAARAGWLPVVLGLLTDEVRHGRPGSEAVVTRLADVLVIQAIRAWLDGASAGPGWLRALRDPQIGPVVARVHRDPGDGWTLERLAREARMSRSTFAARFAELAGEPAVRYVTRWRMHRAGVALARGARVGELARQFGYESEAAFARAYKRVVGTTPGAVRAGSAVPTGPGTAADAVSRGP
ncbi:AraC family transcriptional regulator [Geodermatophilus sp. YIM 151500]|uniref:AraC family transcriptional regulator n=1 Tax=Geodermatophilus sp. YIM 151500 TaxID=2984531 RepID=UPI0021E35D4C|nr:AraC family transcriptional regulator [Geodermatophilus sp. YIM 151500]MCV2490598.1 AraC family transcriptional regulator [Geodermatophilus sp. YIM 151500]